MIIYHFFQLFAILHGWPMSDIGPSEVLMLLCSYEECTKETINPKELESGELMLSESLTQEDFDMAHSVSTFYLNCFILLAPYLNLDLCPNFSKYFLLKLFHSAGSLPQPRFVPKFESTSTI